MGLWVPTGAGDFTWQQSNVASTRPAAGYGASLTPGNNSKGSYVSLISSATNDVYGVLININSGATSAAGRDIIVDIGVDPAGGTSYTVLIPDLLGSCASTYGLGGGISYYFPIWIKAGSQIAARASVNNATVGTVRVVATVFGKPRDPNRVKVGTYCTAFGITAASSQGTGVTSGTSSEGSWTVLSAATSKPHWWWQLGMGCNDSTMTSALLYGADLSFGDASNKIITVSDRLFHVVSAAEALASQLVMIGCERYAKSGLAVYGRLQCSGTADSALSLAGYAVGG